MSCKEHSFTNIAPEVSFSELSSEDSIIWKWCIRCGSLSLDGMIFLPGLHQRLAIVCEQERNSQTFKEQGLIDG